MPGMFVHQMQGRGYATMSTTARYSRVAGMLILMIVWGSVPADAAGPQLSASSVSVTNEEPWLLYGVGLDDPGLKIRVATLALEKTGPPSSRSGDYWKGR